MRKAALRVVFISSVLFSLLLGLPSASDAGTRVYVRVGPPTPIVEVRSVRPGPRYVWVNGYHRWDGRAYVWSPGRWVVPPRAHAVWVAPRWSHNRHGWFVVEGHWR
jgi:hypothetical protein